MTIIIGRVSLSVKLVHEGGGGAIATECYCDAILPDRVLFVMSPTRPNRPGSDGYRARPGRP
jgi:hypothetical protein